MDIRERWKSMATQYLMSKNEHPMIIMATVQTKNDAELELLAAQFILKTSCKVHGPKSLDEALVFLRCETGTSHN